MNYAILRTEKLNNFGSIGGSLSHTFRSRYTANADPSKSDKNKTLIGPKDPKQVLEKIKNRLQQIKGSERKNGVKCIELLLTFSPEMKDKINGIDWAKSNISFLKKKFGIENLISCSIHLDEKTPHLVAYVIPEVNGKMNCREILGGREKLRKLQDDYAQEMEKYGLERGIKGSISKHKTIKKYYSEIEKLEKDTEEKINQFSQISNLPEKKIFEKRESFEDRIENWKEENIGNISNSLDEINKNKVLIENQKERIEIMERKIKNLEEEKTQAQESVKILTDNKLSKEQINQLRKLDISLVATRMDFFDEIKKGENPIDLLMRVNHWSFQEATFWLYEEFGTIAAGSAIAEFVEVKKPEAPFTKADKAILHEVKKQLDALGCDKYRISIIPESGKPYLPGKPSGKKSLESFYSKKDIENMIPYLRYENNQGKNIVITPMDDNAYYILLDDCTKTLDQIKAAGFQPCIFQNSSWESSQAVFKISKDFDREKQVLPWFNELNKKWGDPKISALRHPFRLAGFRNMKGKHLREGQRPFVKLIESVNIFCKKTMDMIKIKYPLKNNNENDLKL